MPAKRVLLAIIDGMSWRVVEPAIRSGRLPLMAALAERGAVRPCTSIFPSITPAATASLVTGKAPREHGIQGAFWYDTAKDFVAYFGDSLRVIYREGVSEFVDDYLRTLNDKLLRSPTLFERAESAGPAACVNLMWRRGRHSHPVDGPLLMTLLPGVKLEGDVAGPDWLFLGEFVGSDLPGADAAEFPRGPLRRFGFNDEATLAQLRRIDQSEADPRLTVAYFPDNDFDSHDVGPEAALQTLQRVDEGLARLAERHGGVDAWLEETAVVLVGDHGHNDLLPDADERLIRLEELFDGFAVTAVGDDPGGGDELSAYANMRAAQVTPLGETDLSRLIDLALSEERVDQVIRADGAGGYEVYRSGGKLRFAEADGEGARDQRGRCWRVDGDVGVVGAEIDRQGSLRYGEYPDALARIADGSPACQDSLWLTACPGCEFANAGTSGHERGSHGSLHRSDSQSILITAGLPAGVAAPESASIVDIAGLCLAALGVGSPADPAAALSTH